MRDDIDIAPWTPADSGQVIDLILSIQRGEFDLPITIDDQPDLTDVEGRDRAAGGEFFVARDHDRVVGTIAAIVVDDNTVALRKMFVHRDHRGAGGLAVRLIDTIADWSRRSGYRTILLGTTDRMAAAHRFYEKHGFTRIDADRLPAVFPRMAVDSVFFRREFPGVVHIREYDPRWPQLFEDQHSLIDDALEHLATTIEHMGSTSVPGLPAKPIIDIVLTVPDSTDEDEYVPQLIAAGYTFRLREPEWFEHRLLVRDWPRVNLHVYSTGCAEADTMRRFRDHLRSDTQDRQLYERVKRQLAAVRDWKIVQDYADAKSDVVSEIMKQSPMIDEAIELYGLDPSEFVAARTRLVKELKAAKRTDDAAAVAKLPRPRMGEYTLNRVARDHADVVAAFAKTVRAATSAQSEAIGGAGGAALRASSAELRTATAALVEAAARQLRRDDRDGPAQRDEVLSVVRSLTNESGVAQLVAGIVGSGSQPAEADLFAGAPEPRYVPKKTAAERQAKKAPAARPAKARPATDDTASEPAGPTKAEQAAERRRQAQIERATTALTKADREVNVAQRAVDAATARLTAAQSARQEAADELAALEPDA